MGKNTIPVLLLILDGWGSAPQGPGNALSLAQTPHLDRLMASYPWSYLKCSGTAVGLPEGQMGNSEVGHLNIGAGRIVYQDIMRINMALEDRSFIQNPTIVELINTVKKNQSTLHLLGLVSPGGVHSMQHHILGIVQACINQGLHRVLVHAVLDGRDTPPTSGVGYVKELHEELKAMGTGRIATVSGRFYTMDRDKRWDRTQQAYTMFASGDAHHHTDPVAAIEEAYTKGLTDEFIEPMIIDGDSPSIMEDGDGLFCFNFRADRMRQLVKAFMGDESLDFVKKSPIRFSQIATMTEYDARFQLPVAFQPQKLTNILSEAVAAEGLQQMKIAETEKYAHVTYFFNGGRETPFFGEERVLVESPRDVTTYDQKPEMSAHEVTRKLIEDIRTHARDLYVCNLANLDMVGHTGDIQAAIKAAQTVDECVGKIVDVQKEQPLSIMITSDHGNCEEMLDSSGKKKTAHSCNPVFFILVDDRFKKRNLRSDGILGDIAPTILHRLGIDVPREMTGKDLVETLRQER